MKKSKSIISWVIAGVLLLFAIVYIPSVCSLFFFIGGILAIPLPFINGLWEKIFRKATKPLKIVSLIILFLIGAYFVPNKKDEAPAPEQVVESTEDITIASAESVVEESIIETAESIIEETVQESETVIAETVEESVQESVAESTTEQVVESTAESTPAESVVEESKPEQTVVSTPAVTPSDTDSTKTYKYTVNTSNGKIHYYGRSCGPEEQNAYHCETIEEAQNKSVSICGQINNCGRCMK